MMLIWFWSYSILLTGIMLDGGNYTSLTGKCLLYSVWSLKTAYRDQSEQCQVLYALVVLTDTSQDTLITFQGKKEGKGLQIGNFI